MNALKPGSRKRRRYAVLCGLAMAGVGMAAWFWWRGSWLTVVLLALSLACVAALVYAWMTERRVARLLDDRRRMDGNSAGGNVGNSR